MKILLICSLVASLVIISCSTEPEATDKHNTDISIQKDSIVKIDSSIIYLQIADSLEWERLEDSVNIADQELVDLQTKFLYLLKLKDFENAQEMLFSEGTYYFTVGRIAKDNFDLKGIKKSKGKLDGAYSYGENPDKIVNGVYWLDSLTGDLRENSTIVYADYGAVGYGFTGNYSSDHIEMEGMFSGESGIGVSSDPQFRILYSVYVRDNNHNEYLMLEFVRENNEWKVYAIGNLEWTP